MEIFKNSSWFEVVQSSALLFCKENIVYTMFMQVAVTLSCSGNQRAEIKGAPADTRTPTKPLMVRQRNVLAVNLSAVKARLLNAEATVAAAVINRVERRVPSLWRSHTQGQVKAK